MPPITSPPTTPITPPATPPAQYLYLPETLSDGTGALLQAPTVVNGTVAPTVTVKTNGALGDLCVDGAGNLYAVEITFANGNMNYAIVEFAAGATGGDAPIRTISGSATGLVPFPVASPSNPSSYLIDPIAVDDKGDIAVGVNGTIEYFNATANGNVAPDRIITSTPGLLDTVHIVLTNDGVISTVNIGPVAYQVFTFPAGANGQVLPSIVTTFVFNTLVDGLLVDKTGNLYVASTFVTVANNDFTSFTPTIQVFAPGQTLPVRTINPTNDPVRMAGMQLDSSGNLYILCEDIAQTNLFVQSFAAGATGSASPLATISAIEFANTDGSLALY